MEGALFLEKRLEKVYSLMGYDLIRVPPGPLTERVNFILKHGGIKPREQKKFVTFDPKERVNY